MASAWHVYFSAAWRLATKISIYWLGAWREVQRIQIYHNDGSSIGWREVYKKAGTSPPPPPPPAPPPPPPPPPTNLTVTLNNVGPITAVSHSPGTAETSTLITATASGGTAPYAYHWDVISWDFSSVPYPSSPNAASTYFDQPNMDYGDVANATFRVTASDALGNVGSTTINVAFRCRDPAIGGGGGGGGGSLP